MLYAKRKIGKNKKATFEVALSCMVSYFVPVVCSRSNPPLMNMKRCKGAVSGGKTVEVSKPLDGSERAAQEVEMQKADMRRGDSEKCGRPLLLRSAERAEFVHCVNPSLQRQKAHTMELAATLLFLASSPTLASSGQLSLP